MKNFTLKQVQEISEKWINEKGFKWSAYAEYCHLVEEVGELGEALVVKHGERKPGPGEKGEADHWNLGEEIGDVLFSTIVLANRFNIDLEECFNKTIVRYDKKVEKRKK
jgi:NTP pyrophosphatase (non-canonical NTP hydrolase)